MMQARHRRLTGIELKDDQAALGTVIQPALRA